MRTWLVKGRPERNGFDERLRRTFPDKWQTRKRIPGAMAVGDLVFLYESGAKQQLIALAEVANPDAGSSDGDNYFTLTYRSSRLRHPLGQQEIRSLLIDPAFLKPANAATIYPVDSQAASLLLRALVARNPELLGIVDDSSAALKRTTTSSVEDAQIASFEGDLVLRSHVERERTFDVRHKKTDVKARTGRLSCEVCDFDFARAYGSRGIDFCEVHHRVPLATSGPVETRLEDLAIVCANCHAMLHKQPILDVESLRLSLTRPVLTYKDLEGTVEFCPTDRLLHGRLLGVKGLFIYHGSTIMELERIFREAVDDYLNKEA